MSDSQLLTSIANFIQGRALERLEKFDKEAERQRKEVGHNLSALEKLNSDLLELRIKEETKFKPSNWLTDSAKRAKQIKIVSHAPKFTHTDAKGSGVYYQKSIDSPPAERDYVATSTLNSIVVDVQGNAAALDVANFLLLEIDGVNLIDRISQGDFSDLAPFAESDTQLNEWIIGFKEALAINNLSSDKQSKQLYFPVNGSTYHLLSPLYATSLAQALYVRITDNRYSESAKAARKARRENKYSETIVSYYPKMAIQTFGGTKQQNVSLLNSRRGGKSFLLSSLPPQWNKRTLPPFEKKNFFWRELDYRAWSTLRELKDFLVSITKKSSTKGRRDKRAELIDELINIFFQYAAEVRSLKEHAGWSAYSEISKAEQLWLDPFRNEPDFLRERAKNEWQKEISESFAFWLNKKFTEDKLIFKDEENDEWVAIVQRKMALLNDDLEVLDS